MQIVQSNFFTKSNDALNTAVKTASCSHGWLRWLVQFIFGAITVASFIMIVHMAMQRPNSPPMSRCEVTNCRVDCSDVKFDLSEKDDVIPTVMETGLNCERIILTLRHATFNNNTMPLRWMSRMPTKIHVLHIIGGNLRHIPSSAFVGQFAGNIRALSLENIIISQWMSTTFVGLSSLRRLFIKNCIFGNIARNALQAIDDTLDTLTMIHSGRWDPASLTGSSETKLKTVDFSSNDFGSILKSDTFVGLRSCKTLYLNSCKITAIGTGAFDPLVSIELLFLSDNLLHTVPPGLFDFFLKADRPKPRIHLENNLWTCDCFQEDLIKLSKNGLLPVDTKCIGPTFMHGKYVTDLEEYCENSSRPSMVGIEIVFLNESQRKLTQPAFLKSLDRPCFYGGIPSNNTILEIVSPVANYQCMNFSFLHDFRQILRAKLPLNDLTESDWLKPTYILQKKSYTVIQVSSNVIGHGLIWYQTSCPNEVYCLNSIPNFLRVYNTVPGTEYTFCPFDLKRFAIQTHYCVNYNISEPSRDNANEIYYKNIWNPLFIYIGVSLLCIGLGAMCVYMIIRKNPSLLKGSKRLLFVKHRNVDALVLPPKVPLRNKNSLFEDNVCFMNDKIFTVPEGKLYVDHFMRSNSIRSDKSGTPTYISARQPTEAQLAEWRIRHHFDKSPSIISISSDISTISWTSDLTTAEITTNVVYESLK